MKRGWLGLALLAACDAEPGHPHRCECTFLTDFDDASHAVVEVCATSVDDAVVVAKSCAQSGAPAPIERCTCDDVDGGACERGACAVR